MIGRFGHLWFGSVAHLDTFNMQNKPMTMEETP